MSSMFSCCFKPHKINLLFLYTINIVNLSHMPFWYHYLEEINISSFNSMNLKNLECMLSICSKLKKLEFPPLFNIKNVI